MSLDGGVSRAPSELTARNCTRDEGGPFEVGYRELASSHRKLTKRAGHTRCVVCHTTNNARFHLVRLSPGATAWTEEQSRQNFQLIQRVAIPGSLDSPIVHHPLGEQAGGDFHHGGGPQFESQQDPAWQALRAFVMGQKA